MNVHYSIYTTHRPEHISSHFNDDARCDNEVNLILESNYNPTLIEQLTDKLVCNEPPPSIDTNKIEQYYFMPIREPNNAMIVSNGSDNSSMFTIDTHHPSGNSLFDRLALPSTVDVSNTIDPNLAALFVSTMSIAEQPEPTDDQSFDEVFQSSVNELVASSEQTSVGPPPGFEHFHFDSTLPNPTTGTSAIDDAAAVSTQSRISPSDRNNFSQFLPSTSVDPFEQPATNHPVRSSPTSSQIVPPNASASSTTNSIVKPPIPNTLSLRTKQISSSDSLNSSPARTKLPDADSTRNLVSSPSNLLFTNDHTNGTATRISANGPLSSSTSSSSSIDEALIQLTQQQSTMNKLFNDEPSSIFHFSLLQQPIATDHHQQQRAVHDNIQFLASMATGSTPIIEEPAWPPAPRHCSHPMSSVMVQPASTNLAAYLQELMANLNELCYRGFDELNTLIQEQRWVQTYLNMNSFSNSPLTNNNCGSSRVLIVPEYFIFKCKKVEITASQIYELLAIKRPELRLRDLMFAFKAWKESVTTAELIHHEEETKLRLIIDNSQSYYMNETVLQAGFDRISYVLRQLGNTTQQARAAFQYATLNVFQTASRQQQQTQMPSNVAQTSNFMTYPQFSGIQQAQQPKSSSLTRMNSSIGSSPLN